MKTKLSIGTLVLLTVVTSLLYTVVQVLRVAIHMNGRSNGGTVREDQ